MGERMAGDVVLITGGAGGIGRTLAKILIDRGDFVILFGRTESSLIALTQELGSNSLAVAGDARKPEDVPRAVEQGVAAFGKLNGLVHCVGSIQLKPLHLTTPEEFASTIEINLTTAFLASRAVIEPFRRAGGGSVVLVSSVAASQGLNNHESIAAAKAGIEGLVRSAAMTYARQGIRFNAVAPGLTDTLLAAPILRTEAARAFSSAMHPLGRIGRPEDVACVMAFLLGQESTWITGQIWGIDGGLGAGISPPKPTVAPAL
jgi:NAD(P)-dependent dehydrogenase (short-subunit alcohol dehydrogenase family)